MSFLPKTSTKSYGYFMVWNCGKSLRHSERDLSILNDTCNGLEDHGYSTIRSFKHHESMILFDFKG